MWEDIAPDTEFTRYFCAGIGPLQLGVVLVRIMFLICFFLIYSLQNNRTSIYERRIRSKHNIELVMEYQKQNISSS